MKHTIPISYMCLGPLLLRCGQAVCSAKALDTKARKGVRERLPQGLGQTIRFGTRDFQGPMCVCSECVCTCVFVCVMRVGMCSKVPSCRKLFRGFFCSWQGFGKEHRISE